MLVALNLRDFVIVDALEINFEPGLTVLTGETGAGKSILVDALSLAVGDRADVGVVREGAPRAEISALFDIARLPALQTWLTELAFDDDNQCMLRRIIDSTGRSRCFINGRTATVQQLREAGEFLIDLHGQHAHQSLLKPAMQRELLDAYADSSDLAQHVACIFRQYRQLYEHANALQQHQERSHAESEQLSWQIQELQALRFDPVQWDALQLQHARLSNTAELASGASSAMAGLSENDPSILSLLHTVQAAIQPLLSMDQSLQPVLGLLESARAELHEAHHALRQYTERLDTDPAYLAEAEQRISQVMAMARKYHVRPEQLPVCLQSAEQSLAELGGSVGISQLMSEAADTHQRWQQLAQQLSHAREHAAQQLSTAVSHTMQKLALAGGHFTVSLTPLSEGGAHGLEHVEFLVAPHAGASAKSLQKVASGGELSRISLALQTAMLSVASVPVLIFDEVDVGIGGGVAEQVGRMLHDLSDHHQVICITHLPQVAAQGMHHLQVSKTLTDTGVVSRIQHLTGAARIDEIARMLGGLTITNTTRQHAREMLGACRT